MRFEFTWPRPNSKCIKFEYVNHTVEVSSRDRVKKKTKIQPKWNILKLADITQLWFIWTCRRICVVVDFVKAIRSLRHCKIEIGPNDSHNIVHVILFWILVASFLSNGSYFSQQNIFLFGESSSIPIKLAIVILSCSKKFMSDALMNISKKTKISSSSIAQTIFRFFFLFQFVSTKYWKKKSGSKEEKERV